MLLIYPPIARSVEAPPGLARLSGHLRARGVRVRCLDLCAEGLDWLLDQPPPASPSSSAAALALKRRDRNRSLLRSPEGYADAGRYARAVGELGAALRESGAAWAASGGRSSVPSLADYREAGAAPTSRADLLGAAEDWERNVFAPFFARRLREEYEKEPFSTLGLSLTFLSQALCAFALMGAARELYPGVRIVLGGGLVSSWLSQGLLETSESFGGLADALLPGRGEDALPAWLGLSPASAPRRTAPDWTDFSGLGYFAPLPVAAYNFSWGCPWRRCSFCPETAEASAYLGYSAREAMAELASPRGIAPGLFHFTDNEVSPLYLTALAASAPPAPWYGFARFTERLADPGYCRALARSGCRMLQLGLESGDQGVLDALDKGTRLESIDRALAALAEAGIGVYLYVLFGTPAEDRDAALRTRDFIAERADRIAFMNVAIFNLPASSEEGRALRTRRFYDGDLSLYLEFEHERGWNRDAVRSFLSEDFEADPRLRAITRRAPAVFTSSHAPFFLPLREDRTPRS